MIGVGAVFSASHHDQATGRLHGHSFVVTAWFHDGDATELQARLVRRVARYDHSVLPDHLARSEDLAWEIQDALLCVGVEIDRPLERIKVRVGKCC